MNTKRAKEYLLQIKSLDATIRLLEDEIGRIRSEIESIDDIPLYSPWPDGQPHGTGVTDPVGEAVSKMGLSGDDARYIELKSKLLDAEIQHARALSDVVDKRAEIIETLKMVEKPKHRTLLELRYIDGLTWEQISIEIGCSWRHAIRIHEEAIISVQRILNKKSRKN